MTYYSKFADNSIDKYCFSPEMAAEMGLVLYTDKDVVLAWNGKKYLAGEIPVKPTEVKRYSVPDLFFWVRGRGKQTAADVDAALDAEGYYSVAITTKVVSANNETFNAAIAYVKQAVGFTDSDIREALAYAETDAAPDAVA